MNKILYIAIFVLFAPILGTAQFNHSKMPPSKELGFALGGSYYTGDLNHMHFKNMKPGGGLIFRYNPQNGRIAYRLSALYGKVSASDAESNNTTDQVRNLSFESDIFELGGAVEFYYRKYYIGSDLFYFTPYMFIGANVFRMNPKTEYNGSMVELQPLETEAQRYSRYQLSLPFGLGFKFNAGRFVGISFEYGLRATTTDYLDDVSGNYVDPTLLAQSNGSLSAALSDRSNLPGSVNPNNTGRNRGESYNNDFYGFGLVMITFRLGGKLNPCEHIQRSMK